jgi:putative hydrolase of the HAD superfamily
VTGRGQTSGTGTPIGNEAHTSGMTSPSPARRQSLIFDADDTLWHNNVLFERVIEDYLDWLAHPTLDRFRVRAILAEVELANARAGGYGARAFLRNLAETYLRLMARPLSPTQEVELELLAVALLRHEIELLPDVAEVLGELGTRHDLYLLTKGDHDEQRRKVDASGLAQHFRSVHIVPEKEPAVYQELAQRHRLDPAATWMIGNSPRSDILPARAAGLKAVYIPHPSSWWLEDAELDAHDGAILHLSNFAALRQHF